MRWSSILVTVLATSGIWLLGSSALSAPAKSVPTWEYHCVLPPGALPAKDEESEAAEAGDAHGHSGRGHHPAELVLNHLGSKGWELVAIDPNNGHYCFKRRP